MLSISVKEFLVWKKKQLSKGGDHQSFNILLDCLGGIKNSDLFMLAEQEMKRIENSNEDISKFKPLVKLYDRADIINDIA